MSNKDNVDRGSQTTLAMIGQCLLCVQQAERVLSGAVKSVLDRPGLKLTEQSETKQWKTLGELLMKLKLHHKLEYGLKERLFKFLEMRNTLVHNISAVPGWNLSTEEGDNIAKAFLYELAGTAVTITMLFITLFSVSAKDEYGVDLFKEEEQSKRNMVEALEKVFGTKARTILAGRNRGPVSIHPSRARTK